MTSPQFELAQDIAKKEALNETQEQLYFMLLSEDESTRKLACQLCLNGSKDTLWVLCMWLLKIVINTTSHSAYTSIAFGYWRLTKTKE